MRRGLLRQPQRRKRLCPGSNSAQLLGGPRDSGVDLSALYIVEQNLAGIMSESYGACEQLLGSAENAFYNKLWQEAAGQGITAIVSATPDQPSSRS